MLLSLSIIFYIRFKDGLQIAGESGSTLSLTSVTLASAGSYRCRANTESRGIYSSEATLTVKGKVIPFNSSYYNFCPHMSNVHLWYKNIFD